MSEQNQHHTETDSIVFNIPEFREYSAETDIDRSAIEGKFGTAVTHILIKQAPFEVSDIPVHNTSEPRSDVIQSADVPFNELEKIPGTIDDTSESDRVVRGVAFKGAPTNIIGHPENTKKMDAQITALTGIPVNNSTDVHDL